VSGGAGR